MPFMHSGKQVGDVVAFLEGRSTFIGLVAHLNAVEVIIDRHRVYYVKSVTDPIHVYAGSFAGYVKVPR